MNPIQFPQANTIMRAPPSMAEGLCNDVHAHSNGEICVTLWQPTPEERAAIAAGAPIYLSVHMAGSMPPISFAVESPFIEPPTAERLEEIADGAPACDGCFHFTHEAKGSPVGHCARWNKDGVVFHYACPEHFPRP